MNRRRMRKRQQYMRYKRRRGMQPPAQINLRPRTSQVTRNTSETSITVKLNIDGSGKNSITTGISFLDHMLTLFSRHGYFDLDIKARGDLDVDIHHTNEDIALSLGEAFTKGLRDKRGIRRFGFYYVPMEDALVRVVLDICNRPSLRIEGLPNSGRREKQYSFNDCEHFLKSFSQAAGLNLQVGVLSGRDRHHIMEAVFKALARALDIATRIDARNVEVPSTKGML